MHTLLGPIFGPAIRMGPLKALIIARAIVDLGYKMNLVLAW